MRRSIFLSTLVVAVVAVAVCLPVLGQNSGTITGQVTDPSGAVIPGATVQAVDEAKGIVVREAATDKDGLFRLTSLPPGRYNVIVKAPGMKQLARNGLVLDPSHVLDLGVLSTSLGAASEVVNVEARQPLVETGTSDHSNVIDSQQVTEISMNGRDFQSLIRTLPGVVSNDSSDFRIAFNNTDAFNVNGMRGSQNNVYLDGAINTDVGANDGQFTQLSMDAVGEFKLQTSNFAAEYGRNPGVLIAVNTKSGGDKYHGTVYEFHREDAFDANSYFNRIDPNTGAEKTTPTPKSKLRFNQFGANLGGPIPIPGWQKKLFFFFNYEGTRAGRPNGGVFYNMPNPAMLTGDFSSALKSDLIPDVNATTCPANPQLRVGTVFRPGTITRNTAGNITCGTPYLGNIIPAAEFSGQTPAFVNLISRGYLPGAAVNPNDPSLFTVPFQDTYTFRKNQKVLRIDYHINDKTNFFFRWVDDSQREAQGLGVFSGNSFPVLPQFRKKPGASWSWNLMNVISPTVTNEVIFSYNHLTQVVDIDESADPATYDRDLLGFTFQELFPNANTRNQFPEIANVRELNRDGTVGLGQFPSGWTSEGRSFNLNDTLTKVAGPHTVKMGLFLGYNQNGQQPFWSDNTQLDFAPGPTNLLDTNSGLANLLLGNYNTATQTNGVFFGSFRFHQWEAFAQDSWKVNRRLTLDFGLRWAYLEPTKTVKPFLQNYFDPERYDPANAVTIDTRPTSTVPGQNVRQGAICTPTTNPPCPGVTNFGDPFNGMVQEGSPGVPSGFAKHRHNNFAPRFGFAYDPWGDGKTAIRGGAGVFFERVRQNVNSFDGLGNPPLVFTPQLFNGNIDDLNSGLVGGGVRFPVDIRAFQQEGNVPTTYSWSLAVQRELPWQLGLEVGYVGNTARHLQYIVNLNQLALGTTTSTPVLANAGGVGDAIRPFKGYHNIIFTNYGGNSSYNGLQVRLLRRFSRNLFFSADYTWSKAIDLSDTDDRTDGLPDTYNPGTEYARASFDRPHVFNVNYVYTLPAFKDRGALRHLIGGWEISGITRYWSGTPFSVLSNTGNPGTLGSNNTTGKVRADYIGGPVYVKDGIQWFNPLVFAAPADGTIGNTGRNAFQGPGFQNWDISVFKNFTFTESVRLQLRLETFNTLNHTNYVINALNGNSPTITSPGQGQAVTPATAGNSGKISSTRDPRNVQLGIKLYF